MSTKDLVLADKNQQVANVNSMQVTTSDEVAASALQAREIAMVQARIMQALSRPRNMNMFRVRLLEECKRFGFADEGIYARPQGKETIEGLSIRFVERALALYGNVLTDSPIVSETEDERTIRCMVTDLETNVTNSVDMLIEKTVERRNYNGKPPKGRNVVEERFNSDGEIVSICRAYDDEVRQKQARIYAFGYRNMGLKTLPSDIVADARRQMEKTINQGIKDDPQGVKKALLDGFYGLGITPIDIESYLGHKPDNVTPAEIGMLRKIFASLRDGETTWGDWMESSSTVPSQSDAEERRDEIARKKIADLEAKKAKATAKTEEKPKQQEYSDESPEPPEDDPGAEDPDEPEPDPEPQQRQKLRFEVPQFGSKPRSR